MKKDYRKQTANIDSCKANILPYLKYIQQSDSPLLRQVTDTFLREVDERVKHRGSINTISWIKDLRTALYAHLGGQPVRLHMLSTWADGMPRAFGPDIAHLFRSRDIETIRFLLTLLQVSRFLQGQKAPDYRPITDPPTYSPEFREEFRRKVGRALDSIGVRSRSKPRWSEPHFTSKGSPSGPAMLSLKHDLSAIPDPLYADLEVVGGPKLREYIDALRLHPESITESRDPKPEKMNRIRAHGLVDDTEAKTRVIAMADYWTQTALVPLHRDLLTVLRTLGDTDLTFGQDIKPFGVSGYRYYSFDLTSATDRLPRFLYADCLKHLYGEEFSTGWERVMVDYPFHGPDGVVRKYSAGQPMGVYSSWPLLALAHHAIVQVAAQTMGLRRFSEYRILGDDIVIRHDEVADQYQRILRDLGVEISPTKTLVSDDTFEFAKRLFFRGQEVSAFPIHGVASAIKVSWQDLYSVLETASKRNFGALEMLVEPRVVESFYMANCLPLFRLGRRPGDDPYLQKPFLQVQAAARAKARRLGRSAGRYVDSFHAITNPSTSTNSITRIGRSWGMGITCVTSTKSVMQALLDRYRSVLTSELQQAYEETLATLAKYLGVPAHDVRDLLYGVPDFIGEAMQPLAWLAYVQAFAIEDTDLRAPKNAEPEKVLELWTQALRKANVRILDPTVFDRSRVFERIHRLKSSCATKAFALEALEMKDSHHK